MFALQPPQQLFQFLHGQAHGLFHRAARAGRAGHVHRRGEVQHHARARCAGAVARRRRRTPGQHGAGLGHAGHLPGSLADGTQLALYALLRTLSESDYWQGAALLARWFRFGPQEIEALDADDFLRWIELACQQIEEQAAAQRRASEED